MRFNNKVNKLGNIIVKTLTQMFQHGLVIASLSRLSMLSLCRFVALCWPPWHLWHISRTSCSDSRFNDRDFQFLPLRIKSVPRDMSPYQVRDLVIYLRRLCSVSWVRFLLVGRQSFSCTSTVHLHFLCAFQNSTSLWLNIKSCFYLMCCVNLNALCPPHKFVDSRS